ncbi:MAG: hypothetical protein IKB75_03870 [Clostridia bacterium]|nr:hypothetical protein [Clostridia bacterium]
MKQSRKKWIGISLSALLIVSFILTLVLGSVFSAGGSTRFFEGEAEEYYQSLRKKGFPADYASSLTELHLLHPTWSFTPLLITEQKPLYTWDYIIEKETEDPKTNLISSAKQYLAYRHPLNSSLYDASHYQASVSAVEYFMDPRNFLNETDIFQFYTLSSNEGSVKDAVVAILNGTFMENAKLENGKTYADYFCEVGTSLGVSPVYLAAKVRNEQGVRGTSPIISGSCGTLLADYYVNQTQTSTQGNPILPPTSGHTKEELKALDGYYNYFNVGASGDGLFSIYYNAMKRAVKGTKEMASKWGGSPSWDTRWKAIYGGTYFLKNSYIDCYQPNIYLQKFNVDSRAGDRNFQYQYMQSITGAMSEGRSLYASFAAIGQLDLPLSFLIPVYGGMPTKPCADPANKTCPSTLPANERYDFGVNFSAPESKTVKNTPYYRTLEIPYGKDITVSGVATHSYGVAGIEYSIDGGNWIRVSDNGSFSFLLSNNFLKDSSHILTVRGRAAFDNDNTNKKGNYNFLCAVFYIQVTKSEVTLSLSAGDQTTNKTYLSGTTVRLPKCDAEDFVGWWTSDHRLLASEEPVELTDSLSCKALFLEFDQLTGASLSVLGQPRLRFSAALNQDTYLLLKDAKCLSFGALLTENGHEELKTGLVPVPFESAEGRYRLQLSTHALTAEEYDIPFSVRFVATVTYDNGSSKQIYAQGAPFTRTARQVAAFALADTTYTYSASVRKLLQEIAGNVLS